MKNSFKAPNSKLISAGAVLANAGQFKKDSKKGWEMRRTLPAHILTAQALENRRSALRESIDELRTKKPVLGLFVQRAKGGFKIMGHGLTVPTFGEAKMYAQQLGRAFVQMGAVKSKVTA